MAVEKYYVLYNIISLKFNKIKENLLLATLLKIIFFPIILKKFYKTGITFILLFKELTTNRKIFFDTISQVYNYIIIHRVVFIFQISRLQTDTDKLNENNNLL